MFAVGDLFELQVFFHGTIPAELILGLGVGWFGREPAGAPIAGLNASGNLGSHAKADVSPAHGGESDDSFYTANGSKHVTLYNLSESVLYAVKTSLILTLNVGILDEGNLRARVVEAIESQANELERETGIEIRR